MPEVDYVVVTAGGYDLLAEVVCEDDDHLLDASQRHDPGHARGQHHGDLRLSEAREADLHLGYPMTTTIATAFDTPIAVQTPHATTCGCTSPGTPTYENGARCRSSCAATAPYIWDTQGQRYLDGLAGLFVVQVGHGRTELAEAAAKQASELAFFPLWSYAHPKAIELAERLATYTPGDLNRVFFTTGGGEAVESAWKLAKQYFKLTGKPMKHKVISRSVAYHGTPQGALSITGIPDAKKYFEPLVPGAHKVPNTNFYRAPEHGDDEVAFGQWAADRIAEAIEFEGPDTVAAVFLEPVQNAGGCFPPPPGYFERVREICDRYDVLMVADEVICAFGRLGDMFAAKRFGVPPDIITCAKGITSGYAPLGAMIASDRLFEPFKQGTNYFAHGYTFGGHPVSAAVALANLDIFEREGLNAHVQANEGAFRATLEKLLDLPIVGDVRGDGYFYGIELVKDKATKETFDDDEAERLLRGFLSKALFDAGLYCRADDRGDPVIQLAPPLICGAERVRRDRADPAQRAHRGAEDPLVTAQSPDAPGSTTRTRVRRMPGEGRSPTAPSWTRSSTPGSSRTWPSSTMGSRSSCRSATRETARAYCSTARPAAGCSAPSRTARPPASPSPCSTGWCSRARRSRAR